MGRRVCTFLDDDDPRVEDRLLRSGRLPEPSPANRTLANVRSPSLTLLDACADPKLFGPWFKRPSTWTAWFAVIAALFALPMTDEQLAIFQRCSGRKEAPVEVAREGWLICGRRAGKSFVLALIAVWLAAFHSYAEYLAPGERGVVLIIATDRRQTAVILRYIRALLNKVPMLARLIDAERAESIDLKNGITISIATCSWRSTRGFTLVACLADELAFWSSEDSANPDFEVLNAIRPAMATIPNAMLLCASSPYARKGALWDAHKGHFGKDHDPILVFQGDTRTFNPTVPQTFIDAEVERDPANASAEFFGNFRVDVEAFINRDAVEACVAVGVHERAPLSAVTYRAFIDPAGGSGKDAMTLCIGHAEGDDVIIDAIRERKPPFSPQAVVDDYATLLKDYRVTTIVGDRYAGEWAREPFKAHGITYEPSAVPKSDLYRDMLPLLNSRQVDLLDHPKAVQQIVSLERRTARSGKDSIDHPPGNNAHDDVANAVAGLIAQVASRKHGYDQSLMWVLAGTDDAAAYELQHRNELILNGGRPL